MEAKEDITKYFRTLEEMEADVKQRWLAVKNDKHKKNLSITKICQKHSILLKNCLLQSSMAKKTYFTPWFYDEFKKCWVGLERWYGNNNYGFQICTRQDYKMYHFVKKMPSLPFHNPHKLQLQAMLHKYRYKKGMFIKELKERRKKEKMSPGDIRTISMG